MHHNQDMRWMGGVRKYMPVTHWTLLIGTLALVGTPFFSGFYSKDAIIEAVGASHVWGAGFGYFAVLAGVFVTSFYSFRLYFLVFWGKERYDQNPEIHHHDDHHGHGHDAQPHESPWVTAFKENGNVLNCTDGFTAIAIPHPTDFRQIDTVVILV